MPFADLITSDLGTDVAAAALATEHAYVIEGELDDPDDLGHVQTAWALAKCLCEQGASIVIDVYAARAHLGVEVAALAPDRSFDIMHEVTLFFDETDGGTLAAWSLGLRKFGRPEIVLLDVDPDEDDRGGAAPARYRRHARDRRADRARRRRRRARRSPARRGALRSGARADRLDRG